MNKSFIPGLNAPWHTQICFFWAGNWFLYLASGGVLKCGSFILHPGVFYNVVPLSCIRGCFIMWFLYLASGGVL